MRELHELTKDRTCGLRGEDLVAYADRTLRGARQEYVEVHVQVCPACRTWLAEFEEIRRLLQASNPVGDDRAHRAAVMARLEREAVRWPVPPGRRQVAIAVPLVLLVLALLTWSGGSRAGFSLGALAPFIDVGPLDRIIADDGADEALTRLAAVAPPFLPVESARLPLNLALVGRSAATGDHLELRYENEFGVMLLLTQKPAPERPLTIEPSSENQEVIDVRDTPVLVSREPRPGAVAALSWERDGLYVDLWVMEAPAGTYGGLRLTDGLQVVEALMAAQDAAREQRE